MTAVDQLTDTVDRVTRLVEHYRRDLVFRAPETIPEHQARLLNQIWGTLLAAQEAATVSGAARALAEFHDHPNALGEGTNTQTLRRTLHEEEHAELMFELNAASNGRGDLAQIAREIADVLYITYGTAWAFGIDADAAFAEVHRAAMDKMNAGLRREDGKIMKPPGFVPPDMTEAVRGAALRA